MGWKGEGKVVQGQKGKKGEKGEKGEKRRPFHWRLTALSVHDCPCAG